MPPKRTSTRDDLPPTDPPHASHIRRRRTTIGSQNQLTPSVDGTATGKGRRSTTGRWVKVKRVLLKANTTGVAPTVITSAKFRSSLRTRLQPASPWVEQVGVCYVAGHSNTIRSWRVHGEPGAS